MFIYTIDFEIQKKNKKKLFCDLLPENVFGLKENGNSNWFHDTHKVSPRGKFYNSFDQNLNISLFPAFSGSMIDINMNGVSLPRKIPINRFATVVYIPSLFVMIFYSIRNDKICKQFENVFCPIEYDYRYLCAQFYFLSLVFLLLQSVKEFSLFSR